VTDLDDLILQDSIFLVQELELEKVVRRFLK